MLTTGTYHGLPSVLDSYKAAPVPAATAVDAEFLQQLTRLLRVRLLTTPRPAALLHVSTGTLPGAL